MPEVRTVNGFSWQKQEHFKPGEGRIEPSWKLLWPGNTHCILKNYGKHGEQFEPFNGAMLVSGGPFVEAGRYETIDEAMHSEQLCDFLLKMLDEDGKRAARKLRAISEYEQHVHQERKQARLAEAQKARD